MCDKKSTALVATGDTEVLSRDFVYSRMTGSPLDAAQTMGAALAKSGLFGVANPEQGLVLALEAMHQQRSIMDLARKYHVIKGRLSMRADAMQAEFQADEGRIVWTETTNEVCEAQFSHPQFQPEPVTVRWTMADAKKAGLSGGNWDKYPRQMLRARVISEGVRMVHPGILVGVYTPEEVQDFEPVKATATVIRREPEPAKPETPVQTAAREERERIQALPDRSRKVVLKMMTVGVTLDDLENGDPTHYGQAEDWDVTDDEMFGHIFKIYTEIHDAPEADRTGLVESWFRAEPEGE